MDQGVFVSGRCVSKLNSTQLLVYRQRRSEALGSLHDLHLDGQALHKAVARGDKAVACGEKYVEHAS